MKTYRIEMRVGQDVRQIQASSFGEVEGWILFWRKPPQGGAGVEYWRVKIADVVSIATDAGA